jgi:type VI secretion system protein ImpJ
MSSRNPVLWKEGLFIKPQHFQQLVHSAQAGVLQQMASLNEAYYGFSELKLNDEYLRFGKVAIVQARGIMPDGTVFDIPGDMAPPPPIEIDGNAAHQTLYLCLPLRTASALEVRWPESETNSRYQAHPVLIKDTHSPDGDAETVDLAVPNLQLKRTKTAVPTLCSPWRAPWTSALTTACCSMKVSIPPAFRCERCLLCSGFSKRSLA